MLALPARAASSRVTLRARALVCVWLCACLAAAGGHAIQDPGPASSASESAGVARRIGELADRGRAERSAGRIDEALRTFAEARALAEQSDDFRSDVVLECEIALAHEAAGRFEEQVRIHESVLDRLDAHDGDPAFVAELSVQVRTDLAHRLPTLGRVHLALDIARDAVSRASEIDNAAARARSLAVLGYALRATGHVADAAAALRRADAEASDLDAAGDLRTRISLTLAECLGELGDKAGAVACVDEILDALEARGEVDPHLGWRAHSIRGVLLFYDDWPGAEEHLRRADAYFRQVGHSDDHEDRWLTLLYLAHAIRNCGRPQESAALERDVLERSRERLAPSHPIRLLGAKFLATSLRDIGRATGERARYHEARALYEDAAAAARSARDPDAFTIFASIGALLLDDLADARAAEPWLREAVLAIESASTQAVGVDEMTRAGLFRQRRFDKRHDPYEALLRCSLRLGRPEEALRVLEASRARALRDLLEASRFDAVAEARKRAETAGDREAAARLRDLPREIDAALAEAAAARAAVADGKPDPGLSAALGRVSTLSAERAQWTREVTAVAAPADVGSIRAAIRDGEALVGYFLGRTESFACLVEGPSGGVTWFELRDDTGGPLTAAEVAPDARALLAALSGTRVEPERGTSVAVRSPAPANAAELRARLFSQLVPAALWERIRGRSLVYLIPHGALNLVPFEALIARPAAGSEAARCWLDDGPPIAYQESGSALVWSLRRREEQRRHATSADALVIADPEYSASAAAVADPARGPTVGRVLEGGRAARAGVLAGDVLVSYAGVKTPTAEDAERAWRARADRQESCEIVARRGGAERVASIEAGEPGIEISPDGRVRDGGVDPPTRGSSLARLPGAAREGEAASAALRAWSARAGGGAVRLFTGRDATETLLSAWAPRSAIIHIAAHQVDDPYGRWESGRLALAPPPAPTVEDDGYVDLDDLLLRWRGRLERCQLVVLSSCRSRTGRLEDDEGFYALPLGFRFAGCPSVIASLWPVDDAATAEMMASFYRELGRSGTEARLDAFTAARRELMRRRPDPFAWAPFVWTGAPR